jgi:NAD(P)-dependent dehydrogenase (short-subunit alcohol dehydrogenase family)
VNGTDADGPLRLLDRFFVTDRVAIVSGSGRGIGAACARTLAEAGADVVLVRFGRLDILINNVGGSPPNQAPKPQRAFLDLDPGYLDAAFQLNVTTALALAQQAVPHLLASGDGAIVNTSSAMAKNGPRRSSAITPPRSSKRRSPALPCAAWARPKISRWPCCSSPRRLPAT